MKAGVIEARGSKDYPVKEDNWDRANMLCRTCMKFVFKKNGVGRCRNGSPTHEGWPVVYEGDHCFQHKLDENKISLGISGAHWTDEEIKIIKQRIKKS